MGLEPSVVTFGCRLNAYESEAMRGLARGAGLSNAVIFNTCAVTAEAVRQAGQAIRKLRRENPDATIIVTGCAAQINPEKFADMTEVDYVIGNDVKMKTETYADLGAARVHMGGMDQALDTPFVRGYEGLARAFVQIQNGCDNRCTFCIIPYGRGPSRSVEPQRIISQIRLLVEDEGYNEIVLTGVDIASYQGGMGLGALIKLILREVPSVPRIRLSSLDPAALDADLWEVLAHDDRLMPHWHLSLQSGDAMILKRMKRRHSADDIRTLCVKARALRPDIVFGADIIAGFPTETDQMAQNTLALVQECDLTWLHVFTYSARQGTPAAKMPQVHGTARQARAAVLRAYGEGAAQRHLDTLIGQQVSVLVEQKGHGCTPSFAKIVIGDQHKVGAIVPVTCSQHEGAVIGV